MVNYGLYLYKSEKIYYKAQSFNSGLLKKFLNTKMKYILKKIKKNYIFILISSIFTNQFQINCFKIINGLEIKIVFTL